MQAKPLPVDGPVARKDPAKEVYEVILVRHGTRTGRRSEVYLNHQFYNEPDGPHVVDYYFWVIRNHNRTILVDTGFNAIAASSRNRTILLDPATAYQELGIDTAGRHQIVITHGHYDHIGNLALFSNSEVLIAKTELDFWESDLATKHCIGYFTEPDEIEEFRNIREEGRLTTFTGAVEIAEGVEVLEVGGHTPGQSMVRVRTGEGIVLLASDAVHFLEELDRDMPFISVTDLPAMYKGFQRVRDMVAAGEADIVVTGHDHSALDGLEPLHGALAGNAAIIGRIST